MYRRFVAIAFLVSFSGLLAPTFADDSADSSKPRKQSKLVIGKQLQLFLDDYIVDNLKGAAEYRLHQPQVREVSIEHDEPWEGSGSSFHSVFKDGDLYKMYYSAWDFTIKPGKVTDDAHPYKLCYAESKDGIHWTKPNLGLVEFRGSKNNNIVMMSGQLGRVYPDLGHPCVFKDENPNAPADARYKALIRDWSINTPMKGMLAFKSPDGFNWTLMKDTVVLWDGEFDSQNIAFWDADRKEYRAYWRYKIGPEHIRAIRTARSDDFINWTDQKDLDYGDAPLVQLYTNVVKSYYRAPHIVIGFPVRYVSRKWTPVHDQLPDLENRKLRATGEERFGTALTESLIMSSRDRVHFKRWEEAFMRPGIERTGTWHYGQQYIAWSMVETPSSLPGAPNEISLYAVEGFWGTIEKGKDVIRRYTIRQDGFVSVNSPMRGGELLTKPFVFDGYNLILNFATSAAGEIKVEILDSSNKPIKGYSLDECESLFGDTIERTVYWKKGSDLRSLKGKEIKLRFVMKDADLYSFRFR